jgi:hypothetical protein
VRGVQRAAAGQHVDELEVGEGEQHREGHHHRDDRRQQRQVTCGTLPARGAVERAASYSEGEIVCRPASSEIATKGMPRQTLAAMSTRSARSTVAEEVDVLVDQPDLLQRPGDDRELRVVDPPERDRRQHGRHDEGQQHERAHDGLERQVLVEQQRQPQAEANFSTLATTV